MCVFTCTVREHKFCKPCVASLGGTRKELKCLKDENLVLRTELSQLRADCNSLKQENESLGRQMEGARKDLDWLMKDGYELASVHDKALGKGPLPQHQNRFEGLELEEGEREIGNEVPKEDHIRDRQDGGGTAEETNSSETEAELATGIDRRGSESVTTVTESQVGRGAETSKEQDNKEMRQNPGQEQVRYLRGVPRETTVEVIGKTLEEGGMGYDEYLVREILPPGGFRGHKKFVELRVANQVVADKLAKVVKEGGVKHPWKLRRYPPQLYQPFLAKRFPPNQPPYKPLSPTHPPMRHNQQESQHPSHLMYATPYQPHYQPQIRQLGQTYLGPRRYVP
jgi:FtsZ-binding cell division protein ZapB